MASRSQRGVYDLATLHDASHNPECNDELGRGAQEDPRPTASSDRLIAAYSKRYRDASRWKTVIWVGSASLAALGLLMASFGRTGPALGLAAAIYALCTRLVIRPELTRAHREAVVLQEQYDTDVFALPWNAGVAGQPRSQFEVEDLAGRTRRDPERLREWYVDGGAAPLEMRVLLWQIESVTWGRRDHRRFAVALAVAAALTVTATILVGSLRDISLTVYMTTLAVPSLPWLLELVDAMKLHQQASNDRGRIEDDLNGLWTAAVAGSGPLLTTEILRANQDRLFANRRAFGRIPEWFYQCYRDRNQRAFAAAAREMLGRAGW